MIFRCFTGKDTFVDINAVDEGFARDICSLHGLVIVGVAMLYAENKPFDITKHKFSDDCVLKAELEDGCSLSVELQSHELGFISFDKDDSIAIAKALGATAEDFK